MLITMSILLPDGTASIDSRQALGKALRSARKARHLDQIGLAAAAGVARRSVQQAEAGTVPVTFDTLLRLTNTLGFDVYLAPRWQPHDSKRILESIKST